MAAEIKFACRHMRLSSVWMLQPDYLNIIRLLESRGYTTEGLERLAREGNIIAIAKKGTVVIDTNPERRNLGVSSGTSIRDLLDAYRDLVEINKDIGTDIDSNVFFHEFVGDFEIQSKRNPLEILNRLPVKNKLISRISSTLERSIAPFTIRFALKEQEPISENWLEIRIEPLFVSSKTRYFMAVVYRSKLADVMAFIEGLEGKLKKIINILEEETVKE